MRKANAHSAEVECHNYISFQGAPGYIHWLVAIQNELNVAVDQLQILDPKTVSDVSALFDAYSELGEAQGTIVQANNNRVLVPKNPASYTRDQAIDKLAWVVS